MGNLAVLNPDKVLLWDGENMKVTNDEQANAFVQAEVPRRMVSVEKTFFTY